MKTFFKQIAYKVSFSIRKKSYKLLKPFPKYFIQCWVRLMLKKSLIHLALSFFCINIWLVCLSFRDYTLQSVVFLVRSTKIWIRLLTNRSSCTLHSTPAFLPYCGKSLHYNKELEWESKLIIWQIIIIASILKWFIWIWASIDNGLRHQ